MAYELPDLPYAYDALEPHINAVTMRLHHDRHHNTYVANLNAAFEKYPAADRGSMDEILTDLEAVPEDIRASVQNNTQTRTKEAQDEGAKRDGTPPGVARGAS